MRNPATNSVDALVRLRDELAALAAALPADAGEGAASAVAALTAELLELTDFFEHAPMGLHWVGPEGTILRVNRAELELLGYREEEYVGRPVSDFYVDPAAAEEVLRRLHAGETLRDLEVQLRCKDGSVKHVLISSNVRREGERFAHTRCLTRDVTAERQAQRRLAARDAVTRVLAESATLQEAAPRLLQSLCELLGWAVGAIWYVDAGEQVLRCSDLWHLPGHHVPRFEAASRARTFARGEGLPGRVWASGEATWVADVVEDGNFPRAPMAAAEDLHGAFGFPVLLRGEVRGVIEFFSPAIRQPDEDLLQMMTVIGSQIGQFLERKRAEQALRDSEQRFRLMAETIPSIVWTAAPDGTITYANEQWFQFSGLSPERNAREWPQLALHPDDRERCLEMWSRALRDGTPYEIEVRNRSRDGSYRWFVTRARPLRDAEGRVMQWFGVTTDIDQSKRGEEIHRFLAAASAALAEVTDYESTLQRIATLAVPAFADWCAADLLETDGDGMRRLAVTHVDPEKVRLAHDLYRRYPPAPDEPRGAAHVLRSGVPEWAAEISDDLLVAIAKDEEHLRLLRELGLRSYVCVPLRSRGRVLGALTFVTAESGRTYTVQDVWAAEELAERAAIAIENSMLLAALKESDRRKDEFLALLAHELRNPLAPIRTAVELLQVGDGAAPEQRRAVEVIDRQARQLTRLVDDLLDVTRITSGKIELRKERVDLAAVVASAVEVVQPVIDRGGHQLSLMLPEPPVSLEADPTRLVQVLANLLDNAAKYTDAGGHIALIVEPGDGMVEIRVRDDGIGIAAETLPRVFELFAQADRSLDRAHGGLGIGLTLVRQLVERHGGTVEVFSEGTGRGTEVLVRLPVSSAPVLERPAAAVVGAAGDVRRRVLVVDDNRDAVDTLAMLLELGGHEVRTAADGVAALEVAAQFPADVVLLDIGLPRLDGYETARRLRARHDGRGPLLVALTGWGQEGDRRRSREAGFDHHLTKPVDLDALRQLLAGAAQRPPD